MVVVMGSDGVCVYLSIPDYLTMTTVGGGSKDLTGQASLVVLAALQVV